LADLLEQRKALHQRVREIEKQYEALEETVLQLQPLANLGLAWAMTAHELNNLLMPVINYAQLAAQHPDDAALCEKAIQKTMLLSTRAAAILEKVMLLAREGQIEKETLPLNQLLDNVFACLGRDFSRDGIRVIRNIAGDVEITADAIAIQQVLMNLLLNARHAMLAAGGVLTISAEQTADGTLIRIADTGCGIEADTLKKIFTPFYTSGKDGGNGLGLAFCRKVIESHNGFITVDSEPGNGTRFKILLPTYAT
jgi:signal transduction histidine kinase